MVITVASGKGGTGKTTVSTNLALCASKQGLDVCFLDCDVEEPNAHIFLKPEFELSNSETVTVPTPVVDMSKCTLCEKCREVCQFNAITVLGDMVLPFPELCHGCGACSFFCPEDAISEAGREVGSVEYGTVNGMRFVRGRLRVGEAMSPPLIKAVKKNTEKSDLSIIDAPPGTSCPVIESVKDSDYVVLVTEPTPFGLNDLKLAVEMLRVLKISFGVVLNRSGMGDGKVDGYCLVEGIDMLAQIPDDRRIAHAYSRGKTVVDEFLEYSEIFDQLVHEIRVRVLKENEALTPDARSE